MSGSAVSVPPSRDLFWLMTITMVVSCSAFFALRGIYFALLEESRTPSHLTGTAVGVICFVGFTLEIFMPPLTGWLIRDARSAGNVLVGYNRIYWILIALSFLGLLGRSRTSVARVATVHAGGDVIRIRVRQAA